MLSVGSETLSCFDSLLLPQWEIWSSVASSSEWYQRQKIIQFLKNTNNWNIRDWIFCLFWYCYSFQ
jgi:hypothetical protein